ncbi:hypothetical protein JG688_00000921 [Phytophthora aleatoria]|uniref:Uncharacterized protein n=1 Tax=Phytophthora aleatoria TaxID=2496075 RepID=A0A8J5MDL6_9STRA|nr:hypothetical protein JG688_00000921 [Phytophthora aleatoria]
MQFAIRQEATLHLKNFAKLSGGTVTVYACSVKPKAQLRFVRFDRGVLRQAIMIVSSARSRHSTMAALLSPRRRLPRMLP